MKNVYSSLLLLVLSVLAVACSEDSILDDRDMKSPIQVANGINLNALSQEGGQVELTVDVNGKWILSIPEDTYKWVTVDDNATAAALSRGADFQAPQIEGEGKTMLTMSYLPNLGRTSRTGSLQIKAEGQNSIFSFKQSSEAHNEILYLNMGVSVVNELANMPRLGLGIKNITIEGDGTVREKSSYSSTSIPGLYAASGDNYVELEPEKSIIINDIEIYPGNILLNAACSQPENTDFDEKSLQVSYRINDGEWTAVSYDVEKGSEAWNLISCTIQTTLADKKQLLDLKFASAAVEAGETPSEGETPTEDTEVSLLGYNLLDDISVIEKENHNPLPLVGIDETQVTDTRIVVTGSCVSVPDETALTADDIVACGFRLSDMGGVPTRSNDWTEYAVEFDAAANNFTTNLEGLLPNRVYWIQAYVKLKDREDVLYSVPTECFTQGAPEIKISNLVEQNTFESLKLKGECTALFKGKNMSLNAERLTKVGFEYAAIGGEYTDISIETASPIFESEIKGLEEGGRYQCRAYMELMDKTERIYSETLVFATPSFPLVVCDTLYSEGRLQLGQESTLVLKVISDGKLRDNSLTLTSANKGLTVSEGYTRELNEADGIQVNNPLYTHVTEFAVTGILETDQTDAYTEHFTFIRKDKSDAADIKVAVYATDGSVYLADIDMLNVNLPTASFNNFVLDSGITLTRITKDDSEGRMFGDGKGLNFARDYNITNIDAPEEALLIAIDLPLGIELDDNTIEYATAIRPGKDKFLGAYMDWRIMYSADNSQWVPFDETVAPKNNTFEDHTVHGNWNKVILKDENRVYFRMSPNKTGDITTAKGKSNLVSLKYIKIKLGGTK